MTWFGTVFFSRAHINYELQRPHKHTKCCINNKAE